MSKDTLERIRQRIDSSPNLKVDERSELLGLLVELDDEIGAIPEHLQEEARSVAGYTELAAHEALRLRQSAELQQLTIHALEHSVEDFYQEHPQLARIINRFCNLLSSMGI